MSKRSTRIFNHVPFTKNQRLDIKHWGVLNKMDDQEVYEQIRLLTKVRYIRVINKIADWVCFDPTTATSDFPKKDRTRALLGALQMGYVTIH